MYVLVYSKVNITFSHRLANISKTCMYMYIQCMHLKDRGRKKKILPQQIVRLTVYYSTPHQLSLVLLMISSNTGIVNIYIYFHFFVFIFIIFYHFI